MERESIQKAIDYIEEHLGCDMEASDLADATGYSLYHFCRSFHHATGMPVMQYILVRRLLHAIYDMACGRKKTDAALDWGFMTYAGFYRSFVREFGYTPAEYLRKFQVRRPYHIDLNQEEQPMVSKKAIQEVLALWGMEGARISDAAGAGRRGDVKYVGDEYVLRCTRHLSHVLNAVQVCKALLETGLSAPDIIQTPDGESYAEQGGMYYFLSRRMRGHSILAGSVRPGTDGTSARQIGEMVGRLDLALHTIDVPVDTADALADVRDWALPALRRMLSIDRAFEETFISNLERLYPVLPRQIIHRDPNPGNIMVDGGFWGFVDFDLSERNARLCDPCYAATAILSETYEEGNEEQLFVWVGNMKEILSGYDAVCHLTREEWEAVPYLLLSIQFIATAWFSGKARFQELFETNLHMTAWMLSHFDALSI
ncbi:MAG: helix-turn-helix domain-containing protein [Clostridia bacterium]|nr:helix-turn-helix domain-containing protein [Clostridia bacterium]